MSQQMDGEVQGDRQQVTEYLANSSNISGKRIAPRTQLRYANKVETIEKWMAENGFESDLDMSQGAGMRLKCPHDTEEKFKPLKAFFGWVGRDRGSNGTQQICTHSTYAGYQSAIANLYRKRRMAVPLLLQQELQDLSRGWKNAVTGGQRSGEITTKTGKTYNRFDGYVYIAQTIIKKFQPSVGSHLKGSWSSLLMSWLFHLLTWNMFQRANTVANIFMEHLSWVGDCLIVHVPGHKGDTAGEVEEAKDKRVYANATNPAICAVLSIAVFIFSKLEYFTRGWIVMAQRARERAEAEEAEEGQEARVGIKRGRRTVKKFVPISPKVFEGDAVEKLHSDNLHKLLHDTDKAGKAILGIEDENEIDTHSNRKGAATHAVNLCDGPDGTNVFMRAGWKFSSTQQSYLFQGGGGDSICGRAASGLPIESKEWCTLPPHFVQPVPENDMRDIIDGWDDLPSGMQLLLTMLCASVVFHHEWLKQQFPENFPLFLGPLFTTGFVRKYRSNVRTGLWRDGNLVCSGVEKIHKVEQQLHAFEERTNARFDEMETRIERLPQATAEAVCKKVTVNGVSDYVTKQDIFDVVKAAFESAGSTRQHAASAHSSAGDDCGCDDPMWISYNWSDGSEHMVPETYRFPANVSAHQLHSSWFYGKEVSDGACMRPLRLLGRRDLKVPGDIVNLSRARKVMELIESHMEATDTGCSNALKKVLDEIQYTHPRIHDVTYNTIHKHYLLLLNALNKPGWVD